MKHWVSGSVGVKTPELRHSLCAEPEELTRLSGTSPPPSGEILPELASFACWLMYLNPLQESV